MSSLKLIIIVLCLTACQLVAFEVRESVPGSAFQKEAIEQERNVLAPFTHSKQQNKLIDAYIKSYSDELRHKALPILKELAANNNISAIRLLALLESNGDLGICIICHFR
ncbi:MAG: hypothetical protein VX100_13940 [Pseudomonadota bacterium]|nr:hypothetical protein [Pseudomonadota bacterium]